VGRHDPRQIGAGVGHHQHTTNLDIVGELQPGIELLPGISSDIEGEARETDIDPESIIFCACTPGEGRTPGP
jgi:hypothetical protein